jgi:hypothetical protein
MVNRCHTKIEAKNGWRSIKRLGLEKAAVLLPSRDYLVANNGSPILIGRTSLIYFKKFHL